MSANTVPTWRHGTSSSSATSSATEVRPPWPCSLCGTRIVTVPSASIASQALVSVLSFMGVHERGGVTAAVAPGSTKPRTSPPPTPAMVRIRVRRERAVSIRTIRGARRRVIIAGFCAAWRPRRPG